MRINTLPDIRLDSADLVYNEKQNGCLVEPFAHKNCAVLRHCAALFCQVCRLDFEMCWLFGNLYFNNKCDYYPQNIILFQSPNCKTCF